MAKVIKTGDYVEVLEGKGNCGVLDGEQGVVVDASDQDHLDIVFPARDDLWGNGEKKAVGNLGWLTTAGGVKLMCRLRGGK